MKLSTKISLLLVCVVAISGILIGSLSINATNQSFDQYIKEIRQNDMAEWRTYYLQYYRDNGNSWNGVERLIMQESGSRNAFNQNSIFWRPVVLVDTNQHIIAHPMTQLLDMRIDGSMMERAEPMIYGGRTIAYLLPIDYFDRNYWILEESFMRNVSESVIRGLLVTCFLAALVGLAVSKHMIHPLLQLIDNVRLINKHNRMLTMPVYSDDEIGELTIAFNQMTQQIDQNNEARVQLFADISHELRTPLTAVAGKLEHALMRNQKLKPEEVSSLYDEILRLNGLVNELQNISLIEAGHMVVTKTLINFKVFFEEFLLILEADASARNIHLEVDMDESLPYCYADPERLKQIVLNLVSNALRYTADGGTIGLKAWVDQRYFIFEVHDTGTGMWPEEVDHVFDRFYRTDSSRARATGGSGLGMAITKGLVDAHNGFIDVHSKKGEGSTFTVRLPLYNEGELELDG